MTTSMQNRAKDLLCTSTYGVLGTHSEAIPGYPYGSLVPYTLDSRGQPIILISRLAQHSRNIQVDPRVSLTVSAIPAEDGDLLNTSRLCLLANAEPGADETAREDYVWRFPEAREYLQLDFEFYRLVPFRLHMIAGFGQVQWLDPV